MAPSDTRFPSPSDVVAVDTETTGLNPWRGDAPFMTSMAWRERDGELRSWSCAWRVDPTTRRVRPEAASLAFVRRVLEDGRRRKLFYNRKFDQRMLGVLGVKVLGEADEVEFMAKAAMPGLRSYKLKDVAGRFGFKKDDEERLHAATKLLRPLAKKLGWRIATKESHGDEPWKSDFWVPGELASKEWVVEALKAASPAQARAMRESARLCEQYARRDAERTLAAAEVLEVGMDELGVREVYDEEMRLWPVTWGMETRGMLVRREQLRTMTEEQARRRAESLRQLRSFAGDEADDGEDFNPNSAQQVAALLTKARVPIEDKTDCGNLKTDGKTLAAHKSDPVVAALLTFRASDNALTDLLLKVERLGVERKEGLVIHPNMRQWGTVTRRFSMTNPPLQCVTNPKTTNSPNADFLANCRSVFGPRPGKVWWCFDYKQLEVVIFADVAGEPTMLEAIRRGADIHSAVTDKVWGGEGNPRAIKAARDVVGGKADPARELAACGWSMVELEHRHGKKRYRKLAKGLTFNKIFGGGVRGAMAFTSLSKAEAKAMIADYDGAFPDMADKMADIIRQARRDGFIVNKFGQRMAIDRDAAYTAVNYNVQSDAAALIKRAMIRMTDAVEATGLADRVALLLQLHDELVWEVDESAATAKLARRMRDLMADHEGKFSVPIGVDLEQTRTNWADKQEVRL